MAVIKFSLSEPDFKDLQERAQQEDMSIQDYIRKSLFNSTTIFTPTQAVNKALNKYNKGDCFTLPELYGDDWSLQRGASGVFGRRFFTHVTNNFSDKIQFVGMTNYGRHAQYKII